MNRSLLLFAFYMRVPLLDNMYNTSHPNLKGLLPTMHNPDKIHMSELTPVTDPTL